MACSMMACRRFGHETPTYSAVSCPDSHTVGEGRAKRSCSDAATRVRRDAQGRGHHPTLRPVSNLGSARSSGNQRGARTPTRSGRSADRNRHDVYIRASSGSGHPSTGSSGWPCPDVTPVQSPRITPIGTPTRGRTADLTRTAGRSHVRGWGELLSTAGESPCPPPGRTKCPLTVG